jgi:hypothetical protein
MPIRVLLHCFVLIILLSPGGCVWMKRSSAPAPVSVADLTQELGRTEQHIHALIEAHTVQCDEKQTVIASQLAADLTRMDETVNRIESALQSLQNAASSQIAPPEENCAALLPGYTPEGKLLFGATEWIWLDAADQALPARIDTGATSSSLSAVDITIFERNGNDWASFYVAHPTITRRIQIESPLIKHVRIRQATTEEVERRPIVRLSIRIGDLNEKVLFTLTDRSNMEYPVMLGRGFIKDIAVVDVARTHIQPKPRHRDAR